MACAGNSRTPARREGKHWASRAMSCGEPNRPQQASPLTTLGEAAQFRLTEAGSEPIQQTASDSRPSPLLSWSSIHMIGQHNLRVVVVTVGLLPLTDDVHEILGMVLVHAFCAESVALSNFIRGKRAVLDADLQAVPYRIIVRRPSP